MMNYTDCLRRIKVGKSGQAEVLIDTPSDLERLRGAMHGQPLTRAKYVRLLVGNKIMMTDAEFERRTNTVVFEASGDALVAGLGIGFVLEPLLARCRTVTVVEKNKDVIALVGPHFPECRIVHADIFEWEPENGTKYDFIYFDIWGEFHTDDLEDAERLEKRFRKRLRKGGKMKSWVRTAVRFSRR